VTECDYQALDPGIRAIVMRLRQAQFETTDSGDGTSKPADERVFEVPHVVCEVAPGQLLEEADRMARVLDQLEPGWVVEATYFPTDQTAILLATKPEAVDE
jgi:hypothetical protein